LFPDGKILSDEVKEHLDVVAVGSEDITSDSLSWRSISLDSPSVQALSAYRPAAEWVQISGEIYATIARDTHERAASYIPGKPDPLTYKSRLLIGWCLMRDIWLENGITRRQAEQRYGLSSQEAKQILGRWMAFDRIILDGHGRWARYVIPAALQRYINRKGEDPYDTNEEYWLQPWQLMFGRRSWCSESEEGAEWAREVMRDLLVMWIDCWLDVQMIQEGTSPLENPFFMEEAQAIGRTAMAQAVPLALEYKSKDNTILTRRGRPNRKDIRLILDQIDRYLAEGHILYVSVPDRDLRGILAGCFLARHGQTGSAALRALQACRATGPNGWKREPNSRKARRYVCSWPAGL
jgi:hypothetical protein